MNRFILNKNIFKTRLQIIFQLYQITDSKNPDKDFFYLMVDNNNHSILFIGSTVFFSSVIPNAFINSNLEDDLVLPLKKFNDILSSFNETEISIQKKGSKIELLDGKNKISIASLSREIDDSFFKKEDFLYFLEIDNFILKDMISLNKSSLSNESHNNFLLDGISLEITDNILYCNSTDGKILCQNKLNLSNSDSVFFYKNEKIFIDNKYIPVVINFLNNSKNLSSVKIGLYNNKIVFNIGETFIGIGNRSGTTPNVDNILKKIDDVKTISLDIDELLLFLKKIHVLGDINAIINMRFTDSFLECFCNLNEDSVYQQFFISTIFPGCTIRLHYIYLYNYLQLVNKKDNIDILFSESSKKVLLKPRIENFESIFVLLQVFEGI